ncbi:MAG: hypothetical protein GEU90_19480 [Gemmatimonas sp.]|nr:hypothetical protein [Gemmatimonas sp.]
MSSSESTSLTALRIGRFSPPVLSGPLAGWPPRNRGSTRCVTSSVSEVPSFPRRNLRVHDFLPGIAFQQSWIGTLQLELLGRLALAGILGGAIGLERELSGKAAGLRTNLLICVGAALFTELSIGVANLERETFELVVSAQTDPGRIAAQIVSGVGFLGAGTIIQSRGSVRGLTTAATIWVIAAIGMAVGSSAYGLAIGSTVLVGFTLVLLGKLENLLAERRERHSWTVTMDPDPELVSELEGRMEAAGLRVRSTSVAKGEDDFEVRFQVEGATRAHRELSRFVLAHSRVRRATRVS